MSENSVSRSDLEKLSDRENSNFKLVLKMLQEIKDELHKTNRQTAEFHASHELKLLEMKAEILDVVFTRLVESKEFNSVRIQHEEKISKLEARLDCKVDKGSAKLIWFTLTAVAGVLTGVLTFKGGT